MQIKVEFEYKSSDNKYKKEIQEYEADNIEEVVKRIINFYTNVRIINVTTSEYIPQRINTNLIPIDERKKRNNSRYKN